MRAFTVHKGLVAPLDRANVDTDAIIPKQFLKSIKRSGFGPYLFDEWRYADVGEPGMDYNAGSDEFGVISFTEARRSYQMGDRLELIVPHCDPVVNLYDQMYGIRNDRVEAVWPVTARGRSV